MGRGEEMPIGKSIFSLHAVIATIVALAVGVGVAAGVRPYLPELANAIGFGAGVFVGFLVIWIFPDDG